MIAAAPGSVARPFLGSEFPEDQYREICGVLLEKREFDLDWYKDKCIKRRIAIRVRALGLHDASDYAAVLRRDERELDELLTTLTIHVSQFFRNPSMFEVLAREILPARLTRSGRGAPLRIWSVGCACGEEPYSLALLVSEHQPPAGAVEILATDISGAILEKAREASYDPQRLVEVPLALRQRYFVEEGRRSRLVAAVARQVTFRRHDVLTDPFPPADLVVCRNVLIYFSRAEQERILQGFAQVLAPGGILVLGKSETLLGLARTHFDTLNAAERIFIRI